MHRITASIFPQICVDFDASKSSGSLKNKVDNYGHDAVAFLCSLQSISITWKSQRPGHFMLMFFPTDESSRNQNHPSPIFPSKISWIHDVRQMFPMCSQKIQHVFPRTPSRNLWLRVPRINSLASASFLADLQALGSGRGRWANRQPPLAQRRLLLGWILNLQTVLLRVNQHSGLKRTALTGCCRPKMCPSSDENKGLCPSVTLIGAQKKIELPSIAHRWRTNSHGTEPSSMATNSALHLSQLQMLSIWWLSGGWVCCLRMCIHIKACLCEAFSFSIHIIHTYSYQYVYICIYHIPLCFSGVLNMQTQLYLY